MRTVSNIRIYKHKKTINYAICVVRHALFASDGRQHERLEPE